MVAANADNGTSVLPELVTQSEFLPAGTTLEQGDGA
jgi:hypothetical protein